MAMKLKFKNKTSEKGTPSKRRSLSGFFRGIKAEVKRITWPSKEDTIKAVTAVAVVTAIYLALVGGLDYIFTSLFKTVFNL